MNKSALLLISLPSKHGKNKVGFYIATVGSKMHDNKYTNFHRNRQIMINIS